MKTHEKITIKSDEYIFVLTIKKVSKNVPFLDAFLAP